jgi:hypothetical protein
MTVLCNVFAAVSGKSVAEMTITDEVINFDQEISQHDLI